jgi:secreted trypsin-like serine protease
MEKLATALPRSAISRLGCRSLGIACLLAMTLIGALWGWPAMGPAEVGAAPPATRSLERHARELKQRHARLDRSHALARGQPRGRPRARASIVGGVNTSIARFPFQVALYDPRAGSPAGGFFCGGVIVEVMHVITAAHCAVDERTGQTTSPHEIEVLAGSTHLGPLDPGSVEDPVVTITLDPHYSSASGDNDMAVLTLLRPLWSGPTPPRIDGLSTIAPLPPDTGQAAIYANPNATPAAMATVSGWGDVISNATARPSYPNALKSVQVPLISDSLCAENYATIEQTITPHMICAGNTRPRVDACYGDSGGPLVVDRDSPAHPPDDYVLAGLVDFGNGCAQPGYPGVYTRIASPSIVRFLDSSVGKLALVGKQAKSKKPRRRHHRHRRRRSP